MPDRCGFGYPKTAGTFLDRETDKDWEARRYRFRAEVRLRSPTKAAKAADGYLRYKISACLSRNEGLYFKYEKLDRITFDVSVMGGKPCIRGQRVTVGTILGLAASGYSADEILHEYPYLEAEDIRQALLFAAWRVEEIEVPLGIA